MIEANGFVATGRTVNHAFWLLAKVLGINVKFLKKAVISNKDYTTRYKGGNGKKRRRLDIPPDNLRTVQSLLLRKLFSRINMSLFPDWDTLTGYKRNKSCLDNIIPHANGNSFIQIDLADAFPSANTEMVRKALSVLFNLSTVRRIFSEPKMQWFARRFSAELNQPANKASNCSDDETEPPIDDEITPMNVMWAMREIILWLTVFEDRLPQGTPTSPFLFNLVVVDCQLATITQRTVSSFFNLRKSKDRFAITIYADNITVSSRTLNLSEVVANSIIAAIESQTLFRVNRSKVHCTSIKERSPNITSLSIGKRENIPITVSRNFQRKVRGLFHGAISNLSLRRSAKGMTSYLLSIYGDEDKFPKQISKPHNALLAQIAKEQTPA